MDNKILESYLDNIAEQVVDEDKIVTYKSLSRRLGIHVNTAKQLLYTYLTNEKSRSSFPISATYLVAGKVVDGSFNVAIVNEADLKSAHSNFVEVTSEHVYSVQKGKNLKELKVLCATDKELSSSNSSNLVITCSKGVLKPREEVKKKSVSLEENNKIIKQALVPEKKAVSPEKQTAVSEKIEASGNNETSSKPTKKTSPKGSSEKAVKKPAGNLVTLFAKAAQKNSLKTEKSVKDSSSKDEGVEVEVVGVKETELKTERGSPEKRCEIKASVKKKDNGNKRKRIQMLSDSEESDSDDEEETVDVEEDEPPVPAINLDDEKEDQKQPAPRNKRKKRKVIDKTVMNEDGYLETRKEIVFETDSENEVEEVTPMQQKKPKINEVCDKEKGSGTAKKQSSLLTFFKKS